MFSSRQQRQQPEEHRCDICGGLFGKDFLLRSHQQKLHGLVSQTGAERESISPPSVTTVIIPAVKTAAMTVAKARGEVPFAVLHMINEIPLIVRVLEQGDYSILKAAEYSDFRESQRSEPNETQSFTIAVVATIYQKESHDGRKYFAITGPAPCQQPQEPMATAGSEAADGDERGTIMQESLGSANLYKTLTQLNAPDMVVLDQKEMSKKEAQPSTSGNKQQKRKYQRKRISTQPAKKIPKQPKVITIVDDPRRWWQNENVAPATGSFRPRAGVTNFRDIATGSLLSPDRKTHRTAAPPSEGVQLLSEPAIEDPFADPNELDFIQVGDGTLPERTDIEISNEEMFSSIV
ncbi:uncharacterized protein LOC128739479 [Sabethes cyaneus]|uniref:uncharacterized protein LOC128739479 n=1 Tax=Sabethes cyaneus TaxID=53552 RepID=UPI00237D9C70|nr:uncharacterized protein LOC128739479 [Sabethes cyaneus]